MLSPRARPYLAALAVISRAPLCLCQLQAGVYDFGQGRYGEKRGSWTPGEWLAGILLAMTILLGLALAVGLCYYVTKRQRRNPTVTSPRPTIGYRRQQNLEFGLRPEAKAGGQQGAPTRADGTPPADNIGNNNNPDWRQQRTPNDSLVVQI